MDLLVTDAVVLQDAQQQVITDHTAVAIVGNRIEAIGPTAELEQRYPHLPRQSGKGKAVIPGFVNAHTHSVLMALRGTVEDWTGDSIYRYMTPVSYSMTPEERSVIAQLGCLEAIRSGTTTMVDPFRHVAGYVDAMARTGLRLWVSEACADIDTRRIRLGDYSVNEAFGNQFFERSEALIESYHGTYGDRVRCQVAAHAPDNCSPKMLHRLKALADKHGLTRTIHLSQSLAEEKSVREHYSVSSSGYLHREGFLGPDLVATHWTFCDRDDIALLAANHVRMAHTPASFSRRGMHKALLGPIREAGVAFALGTDNMSEDMFQAMAFGSVTWRTGRGREGGLMAEGGIDPGPGEIFHAATLSGAQSVGAGGEIGSLEVGKKADLVLINLNTVAMRPLIRLTSNLVHYGHPGIVDTVIVDGEYVLREAKVVTFDELALLQEAESVTRRVWQRMFDENPDIVKPKSELPWLDA
ncbi:amidohydrolase family protein [Paraburkholderia sp. BR10882]|uniref:amidohydrolase family protein n=1 Tax=unclassified Paraburkholderia TaxID=2615204 RepID=UPI0034CD889F